MKHLLISLLLAPAALLAPANPGLAQSLNIYEQNYGSNTYGRVTGPGGYSGTYNHQRIGNQTYSTYRDNSGTVRCTTQVIGNQVYQNCR